MSDILINNARYPWITSVQREKKMSNKYPSYIPLRYYYSDKKTSDPNKVLLTEICASILLTEHGQLFVDLKNGNIVEMNSPYSLKSSGDLPYDWVNKSQLKHVLKRQPYDFDDCWSKHSMYSKSLYEILIQDIMDFQIKLITNELIVDPNKWIHY